MKYPLTNEAFEKFLSCHEQLGEELRTRSKMRYGMTIELLEKMMDLMIWQKSWERKPSR